MRAWKERRSSCVRRRRDLLIQPRVEKGRSFGVNRLDKLHTHRERGPLGVAPDDPSGQCLRYALPITLQKAEPQGDDGIRRERCRNFQSSAAPTDIPESGRTASLLAGVY